MKQDKITIFLSLMQILSGLSGLILGAYALYNYYINFSVAILIAVIFGSLIYNGAYELYKELNINNKD